MPLPEYLQPIDTQWLNNEVERRYLENKLKRRIKIYQEYKKNKKPNFNYQENTKEIKYLKEELKKRELIKLKLLNLIDDDQKIIGEDIDVEKIIELNNVDIPSAYEKTQHTISDAEDKFKDEFKEQMEILKYRENKNQSNLSHELKYGYSFLPPEYWNMPQKRHKVCVTEKECPVCPIYADNSTANLLDVNSWSNAVVKN